MKNVRLERINSELKKAIAYIIDTELRDPQIDAMVSVSNVDITLNLEFARVYITSIGNTKPEEVLNRIKGAAGFIRGQVSKKVKLRITPRLDFHLDTSEEYYNKIDNILKNITYSTQEIEDDKE